jgi:hypothetical protein
LWEVADSVELLVAWLACRWLFFLLFIRLMQGFITVNILIATAALQPQPFFESRPQSVIKEQIHSVRGFSASNVRRGS